MSPRFLFVNKDAGSASLTRSNASEQSSINSHVQRGRKHNRSGSNRGRYNHQFRQSFIREESNTSTDSSKTSLTSTDGDSSYSAANKESSEERDAIATTLPSHPRHTRRVSRAHPQKPRLPKNSVAGVDVSERYELAKQSAAKGSSAVLLNPAENSKQIADSPADITQVISDPLDPFGQSVVKLDPHVAKLCSYFCEKYHPSVWDAESRTSPGGSYTYQNSAPAVIRRAMQNEVEMNAILACMAARIENVDLIPGQGTDKYMGNALTAVRRRFSSASKHQLLLIIFHLYAGEAYRQNYAAAKIHMRAAKALFASWGGLGQVPDPCVKELFIIGDGHMSAVLLEPCDLPCEYDPGPYWTVTPPALQLAAEPNLSSIAPALQAKIAGGYFPDELAEIVKETVECVWVLTNAAAGSVEATKNAARWVQWRHAAIRYRLLAMKFSNTCHEALRVALLMWILTTMVVLGLRRLGYLIAPKLQAILQRQSNAQTEWVGLTDVKIWILSVGAMCSSVDSEVEGWFLEELFKTGLGKYVRKAQSTHPDLDVFDVLKTFQEKFFYHDPVQHLRLKRLAYLVDGRMRNAGLDSNPAEPINRSVPIST
ncbi:hypothetical protein ABEF95_007083 [Exophiala dermatitidis]